MYGQGNHSPIWASRYTINTWLSVGSRVYLERSAGGTTWFEGAVTRTIDGKDRYGILWGVNDTEMMLLANDGVLWMNGGNVRTENW